MNSDFNDILITPAVTSSIRSRSEINQHQTLMGETNWLPVIVSPMDTVIGLDNWELYLENKMPICFPRGIYPTTYPVQFSEDDRTMLQCFKDVIFYSYSLDQVSDLVEWLVNNPGSDLEGNVLIDIANGHMQHMVDLVRDLRSRTKMKIMVGNIANPETYRVLSEAGADFIRVGIGFGGGCFEENTLIKTNSGNKRIIDINDGDYVLTHDGSFQEVIGKSIFKSNNLLKINGYVCTSDHEFYVIKKDDETKVNDSNIHEYAFYLIASKITNEHLIVGNV
jgi:hypothetical protein